MRAYRRVSVRRATRLTFTLVELLIVLAIIGIISVIAIPRFGDSLARLRVERAAQRIVNDLALAQRRARTTSASQTVIFDVVANTYTLQGMAHLDRSGSEYVVDLSEEPYGAVLISADLGGDAKIIFDGYGTSDSGGTVVVQVDAYSQKISVNADTGEASTP